MFSRLLTALLLSSAVGFVNGLGFRLYDFGVDYQAVEHRQSSQIISIGRIGNDGDTPRIRQEVRELKNDHYKWNLYILALNILQNMEPSRPDSWYQITGIHGFPFESWAGVAPVNSNPQTGYCTHSSILFPTWHRPYLALVEQLLGVQVVWVASLFNDPNNMTANEQFQKAAREFAMPYWEWAAYPPEGGPIFLDDFGHEMIDVYGPNGVQRISNPLYSYHFSTADMQRFPYTGFNQWGETKRHPQGTGPNATSSNTAARDMIQESVPNLQERLFTVLTTYNNFTAFSNKKWDPKSQDADSIESIHDRIHLAVGRRGHMEYIVLSSFDPVFFLHHTNVDRLTAIWQALHPDSYVTRWEAVEPSFTINVGDVQDANSPLTPFYNSQGRFWTSNSSRETTVFGYEYADTAGFRLSSGGDGEAVGRLRETVRRKYGGQSPSELRGNQNRKRSPANMAMAEAGRRRFREGANKKSGKFVPEISYKSSVPCPEASAVIKDGYYREWVVNVKVRNSDIHGPSSVLVFLGDLPDSPKDWSDAPNLVGACALFSMDGVSNPNNEVAGTIPLTGALMKMVSGKLVDSMNPEDITSYLKKHLHFTVAGAGGDIALNPRRMPGLEIQVVTARVQNPKSDREFPVREDYEFIFSMTEHAKAST